MGDRPASGAHDLDETLVAPPLESSVGSTPLMAASSAARSNTPISAQRQVLGHRYEILALLGAGGMGTVYRARDLELEEMVALKVLRRELIDAPGILERFRREVKLARRVTHRNVARVFDIGEHEGEKFLTMELVEGESLSAVLAREGALSVARAVEIGRALADGLASAHAAGVVHRDLKPDNVLIGKDGRVVITDFGIARGVVEIAGASSTMGMLLGTPAYMAPEQVEGRADVDARADVYAFGALMYELFTGARAWPGDSPFAVASARLVSAPPDPRAKKPNLLEGCAELTLRCLARKPEDRPASMTQIAAELAALAPVAAEATIPIPRPAAATVATPTPAVAEKTVAVLPFRNAGAAEDDYLAEELTDDLIDALSMTRRLKVRSRGTVARFRGTEMDPREVGRELGVQVVAEGSVRRARGTVRISARLVSVSDGFQLWAKRFDRPEQDVLSINDEVARAIAEALAEGGATAREAPSDPVAIDLYIRGRHEYRKYWPDHMDRAVELLEQARALAPADPSIQSWLALALARRAFFAVDGDFEPARRMAEAALAAAPNLGEAQFALSTVLFHTGEPAAATRALRQAIARSPGLADAHAALGRILVEAGAPEEGIRRLELGLALDADIPNARQDIGRTLALLGRWDEADVEFEKLRARDDAFTYWTLRARIALWRSRPDLAEALMTQLTADSRTARLAQVMIEIATGKVDASESAAHFERLANSAPQRGRRRAFFFQLAAEMNGFLHAVEPTLDAMEKSVEAGLIDRLWMERCPALAAAREHPRYARIHADLAKRTDDILAAYRTP